MVRQIDLSDMLTKKHPLGLPYTEANIQSGLEMFEAIYDDSNSVHLKTELDRPTYIIGRKGSGKTAFLIGESVKANAHFVLLNSHEVYLEIEKLRVQYHTNNGLSIGVDDLAHVWRAVLYHAAMWTVSKSAEIPPSDDKRSIFTYISNFGDPLTLTADKFLAKVGAKVRESVLSAPDGTSLDEACWELDTGRFTATEARDRFGRLLEQMESPVAVFVDNLEDLHLHLDERKHVIAALFRVTTHDSMKPTHQRMPFQTRFSFPAELLPQLQNLTANADKELSDPVVIRWTASELLGLAGSRVRAFLATHYPAVLDRHGIDPKSMRRDRRSDEAALRIVLPDEEIVNGLGTQEDAVAYVMRHTQLVPRHVIEIINAIIKAALAKHPHSPVADEEDVLAGVRAAEGIIVASTLTSHSYEFDDLSRAIEMIKNRVPLVGSVGDWRVVFNQNDVKESGMSFRSFIEGCVAVGAIGIATESEPSSRKGRYQDAAFAYTFADSVVPVEGEDEICIHPLFMSKFFDLRQIHRLRKNGTRPIYPYGSDPEHDEHDN